MTRSLGPWIALAGAFIGAGLYLGLRDRSARPPAAPPVTAPEPVRDRGAIERDVAAAFEAQQGAWRRACWDPIVAKSPAPASSVHAISVSIDPEGKEILRSINDVRDQTRADVAACLREQPFTPIQVTPPPGQSTSTTVTLQFP